MGACVVAASSVAIPARPSKIAVSEPGSHSAKSCANSIPVAIPTNSVGVNTPPGAPDPLLASTANELETQLDLERDFMGELGNCRDYREGVAAFVAKRAPHFTGE